MTVRTGRTLSSSKRSMKRVSSIIRVSGRMNSTRAIHAATSPASARVAIRRRARCRRLSSIAVRKLRSGTHRADEPLRPPVGRQCDEITVVAVGRGELTRRRRSPRARRRSRRSRRCHLSLGGRNRRGGAARHPRPSRTPATSRRSEKATSAPLRSRMKAAPSRPRSRPDEVFGQADELDRDRDDADELAVAPDGHGDGHAGAPGRERIDLGPERLIGGGGGAEHTTAAWSR